jgi:hypothetical protein
VHYDSDREVLENALPSVGLVEPENARVVQIKDTLHLGEVLVSESFQEELAERSDLEVVEGPFEMQFDSDGMLNEV